MPRTRTPWALALAVTALAGCGGGERTFSAEELVEEANASGAELVLGEPLSSTREGAEVRELSFEEHAEPDAGEAAHAHGGGTLAIMGDAEAGLAEYERCESAATLLCFRASNAVLLFEGELEPAQRAGLERALRALASD